MLRFLVVALALCASPLWAQSQAPVYPTYEGYAPNPDGSFTLVFGYYNANAVPVTIPAGEGNNSFDPGPADRGQPEVFLPGRHRNSCVVVVGPEHEGRNLQWTIAWGGDPQATTEKGGPNALYLLEEIGSAYRRVREIDTASAQRGLCLNGEPVIAARGEIETEVGVATELRTRISDDGLPRESALAIEWTQTAGPATTTIAGSATEAPTVTLPEVGEYRFQVRASDGELTREREILVLAVARRSD